MPTDELTLLDVLIDIQELLTVKLSQQHKGGIMLITTQYKYLHLFTVFYPWHFGGLKQANNSFNWTFLEIICFLCL